MTTLSDILDRLSGVKKHSDDRYSARCPAHDDVHASLSITQENKKLLIYCHAGCEYKNILDAIGIDHSALNHIENEIVYDYHDADGKLLFQVVRKPGKNFRQRQPDGNGGWIWNVEGIERVPYHLPEVINAVKNNIVVYIVEGEKDVDNLQKIGLIATCNPGGALKWRESYSKYLEGAKVVIVPDEDEAGIKHAKQVKKFLRGIAGSIKTIKLPNDEKVKGYDISDWLADGGNREKIESLVAETETDKKKEVAFRPVLEAGHILENHKLLYVEEDSFYLWIQETGIWKRLHENRLNAIVQNHLSVETTSHRINEVRFALMRHDRVMIPDGNVLNGNRNLINLQNGMYDTETDKLSEPAPSFYNTLKLDYPYDPNAKCPRWLQFVQETQPDDTIAHDALQEAFGYSLVPDVSQEKSFFLYGRPSSGKSRALMVLEALVGTDNTSRIPLNKISEPFFFIRLRNMLVNIAPEIEVPEIDNAEAFRQIVSGEPVEACYKFQNVFKFIPFSRLWWASNNQTKWRDTSGAIDRRLLIFNFDTSFADRQDKTLIDKLLSELPGIFNWSIAGLRRLRERDHFQESPIMKQRREEVLRGSNPCFAFVAEKCTLNPHFSCFRSDLYQEYRSWSILNGYKNPVSSSKFTRDVQRAHPQIEAPEAAVRNGTIMDRLFIGLDLFSSQSLLEQSSDD